jgi:hypothetical protein
MKMKKLIVLTLAVLMVLGLFAGCQPADNSGKPVLKVAVSPDFAPMEFVDPTKTGQDKFVGFDISLAKSASKVVYILPLSAIAGSTRIMQFSLPNSSIKSQTISTCSVEPRKPLYMPSNAIPSDFQ